MPACVARALYMEEDKEEEKEERAHRRNGHLSPLDMCKHKR